MYHIITNISTCLKIKLLHIIRRAVRNLGLKEETRAEYRNRLNNNTNNNNTNNNIVIIFRRFVERQRVQSAHLKSLYYCVYRVIIVVFLSNSQRDFLGFPIREIDRQTNVISITTH